MSRGSWTVDVPDARSVERCRQSRRAALRSQRALADQRSERRIHESLDVLIADRVSPPACCCSRLRCPPALAAWEPTKPVEFIVPAGTGGGADQMARFMQGVVAKNNLMKQPFIVVNKSGGAGAEGFLDVKEREGRSRTRSSSRCRTCSRRRSRPACRSTGRT